MWTKAESKDNVNYGIQQITLINSHHKIHKKERSFNKWKYAWENKKKENVMWCDKEEQKKEQRIVCKDNKIRNREVL